MTALSAECMAQIKAMMNDANVRYPQRVRFFIHSCKECLGGHASSHVSQRLDLILSTALQVKLEWHSSCVLLLTEAVSLGALARFDCDFFISQLSLCVPSGNDRPPAKVFRRVGQPRAY